MALKDSMKTQVITVKATDNLGTAAKKFVKHHIGTLPVIDTDGSIVGVLQLRNLLTLVLPAFTKLMEDFDFVSTFGAASSRQPSKEEITMKVTEVMEPPVYVEDTCELTRAFAILHHYKLTDLPVVDKKNCVVGIVSRVDVGTALLKQWEIVSGE